MTTMEKGQHLHLDCFAGIAGDMFLAAMIDLGVPEAVIREGLAALDVHGYTLRVERVRRMGLAGIDLHVDCDEAHGGCAHIDPREGHGPVSVGHHHDRHDHSHAHEPARAPAHDHRTYASIRAMIEGSRLPSGARARALDIFARVARAEAHLHGATLDEVAFHEVGAIDSIVDIVGAALALDHLAPSRVTSRRVPLGHGFTRCAHGEFPVPAPATVAILAEVGAEVEDGGAAIELCTPTGAAILASCVDEYRELPAGRVLRAGYGAGDAALPDRPNLLRAILLEPPLAEDPAERDAVVIEANVDDMAPEWCGHLMERLFAAGARDVWYAPIVMKKGRPALTVGALCAVGAAAAVGSALLSESTTIGYRQHAVSRRTLSRSVVEVETRFGRIPVKVASDGERALNAAPEFEACRAAAERHRVPLKEVYLAANTAYATRLADSGRPG
jgi:hypothetical protein